MQEPIELSLHRKLKAGDFVAALALSEELVKRVLYSKWEAGDALAVERKARPQAIAEDVPLPLSDSNEQAVIELPPVKKPAAVTKPAKKPMVTKKVANKEALGKPFISLLESMNGKIAQELAVAAFRKKYERKPSDQAELARFLGFNSARNIAPLNREMIMTSYYAEYLSKVLGPQILTDFTIG